MRSVLYLSQNLIFLYQGDSHLHLQLLLNQDIVRLQTKNDHHLDVRIHFVGT